MVHGPHSPLGPQNRSRRSPGSAGAPIGIRTDMQCTSIKPALPRSADIPVPGKGTSYLSYHPTIVIRRLEEYQRYLLFIIPFAIASFISRIPLITSYLLLFSSP